MLFRSLEFSLGVQRQKSPPPARASVTLDRCPSSAQISSPPQGGSASSRPTVWRSQQQQQQRTPLRGGCCSAGPAIPQAVSRGPQLLVPGPPPRAMLTSPAAMLLQQSRRDEDEQRQSLQQHRKQSRSAGVGRGDAGVVGGPIRPFMESSGSRSDQSIPGRWDRQTSWESRFPARRKGERSDGRSEERRVGKECPV